MKVKNEMTYGPLMTSRSNGVPIISNFWVQMSYPSQRLALKIQTPHVKKIESRWQWPVSLGPINTVVSNKVDVYKI